jgi:hypothetical protein
LRNQIDYAESLYCTMVLLGFDRPFSSFCDEILETGAVRFCEWIFPYRYDRFIANLASLADVDVIVRSYDKPAMGSPVQDFLSVVGLGEPPLPATRLPRENQRRDVCTLVQRYLANCTGDSADSAELAALGAFLPKDQPAHARMSWPRQIRFVEAFDTSNRVVGETYGLPPFERMRPERLTAVSGLPMEDIFGPDPRAIVQAALLASKHPVD